MKSCCQQSENKQCFKILKYQPSLQFLMCCTYKLTRLYPYPVSWMILIDSAVSIHFPEHLAIPPKIGNPSTGSQRRPIANNNTFHLREIGSQTINDIHWIWNYQRNQWYPLLDRSLNCTTLSPPYGSSLNDWKASFLVDRWWWWIWTLCRNMAMMMVRQVSPFV